MAIGGFRETFTGHGCEDFDLIHRLSAFYSIGKRPDDYSDDTKSQFPADYRGFRRYFSFYAVPHLFRGLFLLHQWHPRPLARQYHRKRKVNEALFAEILRESTLTLPKPLAGRFTGGKVLSALNSGAVCFEHKLAGFDQWLQEQQEQAGYPVSRYPGFFCYGVGVKKAPGSLWRKVRKLLLNPSVFFRDAILRKKGAIISNGHQ